MLYNETKGFTLIELLVVVAIIGMLSSIVLASLQAARTRGVDVARAGNIKSLKTAMELYYNDNGTYPQAGASGAGTAISTLSATLVSNYIGGIAPQLVTDSDAYVWGPTNAYGLYVYLSSGWCVTGVNINAGWWGGPPACNF